MPEINLTVKIVGGKKTPLEVWVEYKSNGRKINFQNGAVISDNEFAATIDRHIIDFIQGGRRTP